MKADEHWKTNSLRLYVSEVVNVLVAMRDSWTSHVKKLPCLDSRAQSIKY